MTYQGTRELIERMNSGDPEALRELQQESARLAKRANVRLKALEEHNYSTPASRRAFGFLEMEDRSRFSESKKLSGDTLEQQLEELNRFLNVETGSTITEAKHYLSGVEGLQNAGILEDFDTDREERIFQRFLESDYWNNEIKKTLGRDYRKGSGELADRLSQAQEAIKSGATVKDLERIYDDFKQREMAGELQEGEDYLSVFEDWVQV